jgi:hypothetical protein
MNIPRFISPLNRFHNDMYVALQENRVALGRQRHFCTLLHQKNFLKAVSFLPALSHDFIGKIQRKVQFLFWEMVRQKQAKAASSAFNFIKDDSKLQVLSGIDEQLFQVCDKTGRNLFLYLLRDANETKSKIYSYLLEKQITLVRRSPVPYEENVPQLVPTVEELIKTGSCKDAKEFLMKLPLQESVLLLKNLSCSLCCEKFFENKPFIFYLLEIDSTTNEGQVFAYQCVEKIKSHLLDVCKRRNFKEVINFIRYVPEGWVKNILSSIPKQELFAQDEGGNTIFCNLLAQNTEEHLIQNIVSLLEYPELDWLLHIKNHLSTTPRKMATSQNALLVLEKLRNTKRKEFINSNFLAPANDAATTCTRWNRILSLHCNDDEVEELLQCLVKYPAYNVLLKRYREIYSIWGKKDFETATIAKMKALRIAAYIHFVMTQANPPKGVLLPQQSKLARVLVLCPEQDRVFISAKRALTQEKREGTYKVKVEARGVSCSLPSGVIPAARLHSKDVETIAHLESEKEALCKFSGKNGFAKLYSTEFYSVARTGKVAQTRLNMVLETFPYNLASVIEDLSSSEKLKIMRSLIDSLSSMHGQGWLHGDLNAWNTVARWDAEKGEPQVSLCDLGFSRTAKSGQPTPNVGLYNSGWYGSMTPTHPSLMGKTNFSGDHFLQESFAFGCLLYQIRHGKAAPWTDTVLNCFRSKLAGEPLEKVRKQVEGMIEQTIEGRLIELKKLYEQKAPFSDEDLFDWIMCRFLRKDPSQIWPISRAQKELETFEETS